MLASLVRFTDDTQGLEKSLRLLQGFCTIAVGLITSAEDVEFWANTRSQFALARRYFRLLKWHPCWSNAVLAMTADKQPLIMTLEVAKWSFLGLYFFLEMFTISNAMGVTAYDWSAKVQHEANRSWFIALVFSILLSLFGLWTVPSSIQSSVTKVDEKTNGAAKEIPADGTSNEKNETSAEGKPVPKGDALVSLRTKLYTQLVIDACDIFIPGSAIGYIPAGPILVGTASTISTTLAGRQIWKRVQERAQQV